MTLHRINNHAKFCQQSHQGLDGIVHLDEPMETGIIVFSFDDDDQGECIVVDIKRRTISYIEASGGA